VINIPQRTLFVVRAGSVTARYPVGLGRPSWPTFVGPFAVVAKETEPTWDVPLSIQEEMRRSGKRVVTKVPPGPANPLGKYWIGLSTSGFGIHGTNTPSSVGTFVTHGCIRMRADDIADLFARVEVGTLGVSIYEPVIVAAADDALWLEAHRDVYRLDRRDVAGWVTLEAARVAPALAVDGEAVRRVLQERDGVPHRIDLLSTRDFSQSRKYPAAQLTSRSSSRANSLTNPASGTAGRLVCGL
jgi:L,D-transpeptidase ErfK/SrfK